ncbi:MAG TPA: hypothetical protein PLY06_06905 [Anaerolineaceae bacterium]|nr:hypothetical protein [Chloroflexota bacterium]HNZ16050.1 hypothetical protein [Anaerolineaceae bacterium]HOF29075.1 hypothetical protein [Anaerolineaceae bacterium]
MITPLRYASARFCGFSKPILGTQESLTQACVIVVSGTAGAVA